MTAPSTTNSLTATGPSSRPAALVVNHWHDDNKGDSAITTVTLSLLRRQWPDLDIALASMLAADDAALGRSFRHVAARIPDVRTRPSFVAALPSGGGRPSITATISWAARVAGAAAATAAGRPPAALAAAVDSADLVVLVGGSNLFDTGRRPPLSTLRLLQCVLPALVARRRRTPYVLIGHTLGPVRSRAGRALLRSVVRHAALVVARESHTMELVRDELGVADELGDRLQLAPDVAFALDAESSARLESVIATLRGSRFAVLVPRSYHHPDPARDERLVAEMSDLGRAALDAGLVDRIVVFPQCLGPTVIEDDRISAARIAANDPRFTVVDEDLSPGEVAELYRHASFVVAVRLHAVILALSVGTPVHGIEYFTNKTRGVFAAVGLDDHWSEFDRFDAAVALARIKDLSTPEGREHIRERAAQMRAGVLSIDLAALIPATVSAVAKVTTTQGSTA